MENGNEFLDQIEGIKKNAESLLRLIGDTYKGCALGYDEQTLEKAERLVEYFCREAEDIDEKQKEKIMVLAGCFFGECIARTLNGQWTICEGKWAVRHDDKNYSFPFVKVLKFVDNGKTDSFVSMYKLLVQIHETLSNRGGGMDFRTAENFDDIGDILVSEFAEKENENAKDDEDENNGHCHGDHWDAVVGDINEKFDEVVNASIENADGVEKTATTCLVNGVEKTCVCFLAEYNNCAIEIKTLVAAIEEEKKCLFVSTYPCAAKQNHVRLKIVGIEEWENKIEATITAETQSGKQISFFDTEYVLHKDEYEVGGSYDFNLAGIVYKAEIFGKGGVDFELTGQDAVDFREKLGEEPEYDENGEIKPVHFCMDNLVAFMQRSLPGESEFQSPLAGTPAESEFFGKKIVSGLSIMIDRDDGSGGDDVEEISIPIVAAKENLSGDMEDGIGIRGMLWLQGCLA